MTARKTTSIRSIFSLNFDSDNDKDAIMYNIIVEIVELGDASNDGRNSNIITEGDALRFKHRI